MAKEVFISYRRDDSAGTTGRIYDRLVSSLPKHRIFMDVDASMHGLDFARVLDEKIGSSDLVAVVIGPSWLTAKNPDGDRRIDTQDDFVRIEVSAALKRGVPVIPILVDGASMPTELDLPNELKPLTRRHAIELRNTRFADDAEKLVKAVTERLGAKRRRLWRFAASTAGLTMIAAAALIAHQKGFFLRQARCSLVSFSMMTGLLWEMQKGVPTGRVSDRKRKPKESVTANALDN